LGSHTKGNSYIECVWEQGAEGIFGRKGEKVAGGWKQQHDEEFKNLYTAPNVIK
jgi:hypothetical protein